MNNCILLSDRRWYSVFFLLFLLFIPLSAQKWTNDGNSYYKTGDHEIIQYILPDNTPVKIVTREMLIPKGNNVPIDISSFSISDDQKKMLIFTNTTRVWRIDTKGDYWVLDLNNKSLRQLGKTLPASSLMFAKISPDGNYAAYVSHNNLYVEDLRTSEIKPLTSDGTRTMINGTFDWVYEEEFFCRDGFRWSSDSRSIAYWQLDAGNIGTFYMINNTDSIKPQIIPIEYPLVGEKPSSCRIGVVDISTARTSWMDIPGEADQNYIIRMEFVPWSKELLVHQLNRKQNESRLYLTDAITGKSRMIYEEKDKAWVEFYFLDNSSSEAYEVDFAQSFSWIHANKSILWFSEKDGWKHLYEVSLENKPERKITAGDYDVIELKSMDLKGGFIYFMASPANATQKYLYRTRLDGKGEPKLMSPEVLKGSHTYSVSPGGKYAFHSFSNSYTRPSEELITLENSKPLKGEKGIVARLDSLKQPPRVEFFTITTADSVTMDGWMVKPLNFDPDKKYPVVFYVYTEPWDATVKDRWGIGRNFLYKGNMAADGYIYISVDNRGTPAPKGRDWRKAIYRQIGRVNIHDQAMAAREILNWKFVDPERVAVWGWSGGGSATLNLLFQYPEIYKTGIAIAAVTNLLTYDNVYQERYMGLPQENMEDFVNGSPLTYAKNLKGNLLYIHGTGDDNVHYQNAEMLLNELIKYNKAFQFMPYPNRTHSISEGEGTLEHLRTIYTSYLKNYCPPGGR